MVWIWGGNSHGQLGEGTENHRELPILMPFPCRTCLPYKPCLCFELKKACYEVDEPLLVSLNIQVEQQAALEAVDFYVVLESSQRASDSASPFLYLTEETPANAFVAEMTPYKRDVALQSEKIILLDYAVTNNIQGDYTLGIGYHLYERLNFCRVGSVFLCRPHLI
ncbi:MAG: hypothetical protein DRR16_02600 [Candidatus Parabeggiatoa sp. nov. 3]|nr:MAG: hypothetical protein DRR00_10565 [Gammaproteobacteria bacterium]RKZ65779.1 MAG: hypothetical protein DRQ99_11740 [Gammaproteobacteria bacterium]RKZ89378.1 MAG: hypothetical protein DRR16_02600 [Gammaproteobacteria bacterium]